MALPPAPVVPAGVARAADAVTCTVEWAPMRDGVRLATEVYTPAGDGPHPVLLQRTPYNRTAGPVGSDCDNAQMRFFAEHGYVALNQDVRGRYRSEGTFHPIVQEGPDGYDAVEWAAVQPWSNGTVGLIGSSYNGLAAWQAAVRRPPHLAAVVAHVTGSDYFDNWTYVNGVLDLWFAQSWNLGSLAVEEYRRRLTADGLPASDVEEHVAAFRGAGEADIVGEWVQRLPLRDFDGFAAGKAPWYYEWLQHPRYDAYWRRVGLRDKYGAVEVPVLSTGGWYDAFAAGTVENFTGLRADGGGRGARRGSRLVMWPSTHNRVRGARVTRVGDMDFGRSSRFARLAEALRFLDHHLKGTDNGADTEPPVRLFVMEPPHRGTRGGGFWVRSETFPLPGTRHRELRLGSGGRANGRRGDGVLLAGTRRDAATADRFVYDPARPVPTVGGNLCCDADLLPPGAFDQRDVERRTDVLVYTGPVLRRDVPVVGNPSVRLFARSSVPDTDFTVKLVDVHRDGYAQNVLDRVVRASLRRNRSRPTPIVPGRVYQYRLDLGPTATVFRRGHRIRLEVSSSNFPHYARNLNTGSVDGPASSARIARQTIVHTARRPSRLLLPVVNRLAGRVSGSVRR